MTAWKFALPVIAGGAFAVGTALHELTHVIAAWATGSSVKYVQAFPPEVGYVAAGARADSIVRVSTVLLSLPLLVGYLFWLSNDAISWRLIGLAAVVGYLPRSESDWQPVADMIK